ncbi:MAG: hypothetical protein U5K54_15705 [Cytophagales bacterium]|nr:hypothetical protein [Cytophagales bacterium]
MKTLFTLIALLCAATLFAQNNSVLPDTLTAEESYGTEYFDENGDPIDFAGPADTTQIEVREFFRSRYRKTKSRSRSQLYATTYCSRNFMGSFSQMVKLATGFDFQ